MTDISALLLFFELELNRIDDAALEAGDAGTGAGALPSVDREPAHGEALSARRQDRGALPREVADGCHRPSTACSTRPWPACASRSMAKMLALEPTLNLMQSARTRPGARPAPRRWPRPSRRTCALFTLITNTLAKDKDISDRWRGFKDIADARHLSNRVEPEVVAALVESARSGLSAPVAPLLQHEGEVAGQGPSSCTGTATRRCRRRTRAKCRGPRQGTSSSPPIGSFAPEMASIAAGLLRQALDRRADAARQGAGRLRASDRALGASLCAAQLPGQDARRDDAGP